MQAAEPGFGRAGGTNGCSTENSWAKTGRAEVSATGKAPRSCWEWGIIAQQLQGKYSTRVPTVLRTWGPDFYAAWPWMPALRSRQDKTRQATDGLGLPSKVHCGTVMSWMAHYCVLRRQSQPQPHHSTVPYARVCRLCRPGDGTVWRTRFASKLGPGCGRIHACRVPIISPCSRPTFTDCVHTATSSMSRYEYQYPGCGCGRKLSMSKPAITSGSPPLPVAV